MRAPDFWARPSSRMGAVLAPLGALYDWGGALRLRSATPWQASIPVICIGNLVAGGAGKTPVALHVAKRLQDLGRHPHFLSRGYGGSEPGPLRVDGSFHASHQVGDEPLLLARQAPAWISRDRPAGIRAAVDEGAGCVVMDDGFQNPSVAKNVSLVVVDGGYGFGNGRVMPAGPLRESVNRGLMRADAIIIIGPDRWGIAAQCGGLPVFSARLVADAAALDLAGRDVVAFAGIGRPAKFFETLAGLGAKVVCGQPFPDHHPYRKADMAPLLAQAKQRACPIVTTAKDHIRLPDSLKDRVRVVAVDLVVDDQPALDDVLQRAFHG